MAFNYKQQYAVVVMCKDEPEQEAVRYGGHFRAVQGFKYIGEGVMP